MSRLDNVDFRFATVLKRTGLARFTLSDGDVVALSFDIATYINAAPVLDGNDKPVWTIAYKLVTVLQFLH